ncbi:MAG: site-2 protease family protein [Clostridia bacterium]|nr:site-2 protease family protein [Clostridia bacterium]
MFSFIIGLVNSSLVKALGFGVVVLGIIAYVIAIMVAIVGHEMAHGYVAYWNGDKTAKFMGRLSLNPIKHLDPIGFAMMMLVGFGWAKPVPIDSRNFKKYKKGMVMTALAGVTFNFIVAFISALILAIFTKLTASVALSDNALSYFLIFISYLLQLSVTFNIVLMAFNLLPIYPLDGFRVVETLAKPNNKYVNFMYKHGSQVMLVILLLSLFVGRFIPQLDILSNYLNAVRTALTWLFDKIFGLALNWI